MKHIDIKNEYFEELDENPDPLKEEYDLERADKELDLEVKREKLNIYKQRWNDTLALRQKYSKKSYKLVKIWTFFVIVLTIVQFVKPYGMKLDKAEFIAIVATALASIISLYLQVGKGIYIEKIKDL